MLKEYKIEDKKLVETQDKHASVFVYTNPTPQEQRFLIDTNDLQTPQKLLR